MLGSGIDTLYDGLEFTLLDDLDDKKAQLCEWIRV